jgi:hypothetical protein
MMEAARKKAAGEAKRHRKPTASRQNNFFHGSSNGAALVRIQTV